jgi:hypothetical protein
MIDMHALARQVVAAPQEAKLIVAKSALQAIAGHLHAANTQSLPTDDQIIMQHVRDALGIAAALARSC